jgi:phosphatidylglycerol:prolipoprotein diacylglycerol transferase
MYVLGFSAAYFLVNRQIRTRNLEKWEAHFENLNFVLIISLILGARLGYALFYNFPYYSAHPSEIFAIWKGGMSFHGALLGTIIGGVFFCLKNRLDFWQGADLYVVTVPIGLGLGRLANFINGELFGRVSDVPWAMVFPNGGPLPRHPSQLYECFLEGVVLFVLLWFLKEKKMPSGYILASFLILYGLFRSFVELFRQPDIQLGFVLAHVTMGQILSICMILAGSSIIFFRKKKH